MFIWLNSNLFLFILGDFEDKKIILLIKYIKVKKKYFKKVQCFYNVKMFFILFFLLKK